MMDRRIEGVIGLLMFALMTVIPIVSGIYIGILTWGNPLLFMMSLIGSLSLLVICSLMGSAIFLVNDYEEDDDYGE